MKNKTLQCIPLIFAILGVFYRYVSNWCIDSGPCYATWVNESALTFTKPLYFFSLYSIPLAILLIFIPRSVFNSWLKLAAWLLPFACIMIAAQPVSWTGIGINFVFISRDDLARGMAIFVDLLSFMLIAWKYFRSRATVAR